MQIQGENQTKRRLKGGKSQIEHDYSLVDSVVARGIRIDPTDSQPGGSKALENTNDPHAKGGTVARNQGWSLGEGSDGMGITRVYEANCHGNQATGDISADVILPTVGEEDQVKGKVVISSEDLNEWNNEFFVSKIVTPTFKGFDLNLSQEDIGGSRTNYGETVSDRTKSWDVPGGQICAEVEAAISAKGIGLRPTEDGTQNCSSNVKGLTLGFQHTGPKIGIEGKTGLTGAGCMLDRVSHMTRTETCAGEDSGRAFDGVHEGGAAVFGGGRTQSSCADPLSEEGEAHEGEVVRRGQGWLETQAKPGSPSLDHDRTGELRSPAMNAVILEGRPDLWVGTDRRSGGDRDMGLAGTDRVGGKAGNGGTDDLGVADLQPDGSGLGLVKSLVVEGTKAGESMDAVGDEVRAAAMNSETGFVTQT
ncbi:hypothetical protein HN873_043271 [Arachis hypogaea]